MSLAGPSKMRGLEAEVMPNVTPTSLDASSDFQGNWRSIVALLIIILVGIVANSAGIGGGAIFIPILQSLVGFSLKDSTALSQALITAGSAVSVAINIFRRSPLNPNTCVIHFSVALALTPLLLVGVSVGVLLNAILPDWLLKILLIVVIFLLAVQSLVKGIHLWKQENKRMAEAKQQAVQRPPATLREASMEPGASQSLACLEAGGDGSMANGHRTGSITGVLPVPAADESIGPAATYDSMEGLPLTQPEHKGFTLTDKVVINVGGAVDDEQQHASAAKPKRAIVDSIRQPHARQRRDWWGGDAQKLNQLMDALLGPIAEEMVHRTLELTQAYNDDESSSWLQRRSKHAWRFLVHGCGELGQQLPPDPLDRAHSAAPIITCGSTATWEVPGLQRLPLLPGESRSSQPPMVPLGRPKPIQPPLTAEDAVDILERLDRPPGFKSMDNPLHDQSRTQPGNVLASQQDFEEREEQGRILQQQEEWGGMHAGLSTRSVSPTEQPKHSWFARFRKWSARCRSNLKRVPKRSLALMCGIWVIFVLFQILRAIWTKCSAVYWILLALQLATMLAVGVSIAMYMQRKVQARKSELTNTIPQAEETALELVTISSSYQARTTQHANPLSAAAGGTPHAAQPLASMHQQSQKQLQQQQHPLPPEPPQQDPAAAESPANPLGETGGVLALTLCFCCFAGLVAGLLGLGGGTIIGPLLLSLQVHPQVSAATSSLMVLFSSGAALISFALEGRVNGAYAGVYSAASIFASLVGVIYVNEKVKNSGRTSIVVFMLATIMVLGFCVITAFGVIEIARDFLTGNIGAHPLCGGGTTSSRR